VQANLGVPDRRLTPHSTYAKSVSDSRYYRTGVFTLTSDQIIASLARSLVGIASMIAFLSPTPEEGREESVVQ
jgi:hypothetical protein